jgi:phosphoglycolate phosphatase-like HAD superfamily hydrolase
MRTAIFDVDGTLVDSVDAHAETWAEALARFGREVPVADVRAQIGKGGDQLMPVFLDEETIARAGAEIEAFRKDLYLRTRLPGVRGFAGVPELFRELGARGTKVVLASSAKGEELEAYVGLLGIGGLHDGAVTSEDADRSKPYPDIFAAALDRAGADPGDAVVVGDSPYDAIAARKLGIACVALRCGGFPEAELRAAGFAQVFDDPEDLHRNLDASLLSGRAA